MLPVEQYGEYFADGTSREPTASALSGKSIELGGLHVRVSPHHFVVVRSEERRKISRKDWDALKADWQRQFADVLPSVSPEEVESPLPDFEAMTATELRGFAADNAIDITGLRTQASLASAVRAELVKRQFAEPEAFDDEADDSPDEPEGSA